MPAWGTAQSVCRPAASTNEARLLAFFASPLAFAAMPEVSSLSRGQVSVAGELTAVPGAPAEIRESKGACGFSKSENSGLSPVFPRPRAAIGLGHGLVAEVSWLPPVTVADATPHLGGLAVSWMTDTPDLPFASAVMLRAHATLGGVDGPVTCPASELQTASTSAPCYGTTPSDDTYDPNVRGAELVAIGRGARVRWHVGAGVNAVAARFRVNFTDARGFVDNNVVEISLVRAALLAGAAWDARASLTLSAQLYSVPTDATTARLGLAWRVR